MSILVARFIVGALETYGAVGVVFAIAFVSFGLPRVDAAAQSTSVGFRILILPGVIAFWPLLARRWALGAGHPKEERSAHRDAAR